MIFTPELEYGLVPLEANAAGTPVIALGRGGVLETMAPASGRDSDPSGRGTAVLFQDPTPEALVDAVNRFEGIAWDRAHLIRHASAFSVAAFQGKLKEVVEKWAR